MDLDRRTMEIAKETGRIEEIVTALADRLTMGANLKLEYDRHQFYFQEMEYANPMDCSSMTMISIVLPRNIDIGKDFKYGVTYESTYGNNSKTTYMNRIKACRQLAEQFVYKVLPKVDFWIRKEVNNREVEDILEVLD